MNAWPQRTTKHWNGYWINKAFTGFKYKLNMTMRLGHRNPLHLAVMWYVCYFVWYVVLCVGVIDVNVLSLTFNAEVTYFIAQSVAD